METNRSGKRTRLYRKMLLSHWVLAVVIGASSIAFGYGIFKYITESQYLISTWDLANAEAVLVDTPETRAKTDQLLSVYDGLTDEQKTEGQYGKYTHLYEPYMDEEFDNIRKRMRTLMDKNGALNAYISALDPKTNRMINLIDSDPNDTFFPPGRWEPLAPTEMRDLVEGMTPMFNETMRDMNTPINAFEDWKEIVDPKTGEKSTDVRCTAGSKLYETENGYVVMAFMDNRITNVKKVSRMFLYQYILVLLAIAIVTGAIVAYMVRRTIVKPINEIADAAISYSEDKQNPEIIGRNHFAELDIDTGDEIEDLSQAMKDMEEDIEQYEKYMTRVAAERERINTELNVAVRIQSAMLPGEFPAFPDREEFEIYAVMEPAKAVGGDFFDFFFIDDDHLALVIADVSGKGIPAALYMMGSNIMINDFSRMSDLSPAKILENVNNNLCARNIDDMFVTAWMGILEISTGKLRASNAGHEYPIIRQPGEKFALFKDKHGFVLGGLEDMKQWEYEMKLEPGSTIFVYTDGVPEATGEEGELMGTERLVQALNRRIGSSPEEILQDVQEAIDEFVGDAEQFDDITMMCMTYWGKQNE